MKILRPQPKSKEFTAPEQPKSAPAQAVATFDASAANDKKPPSDLNQKQKIATTGETIPLVFGKRVSDKGGVWVAPSLLKSGTRMFEGRFLYAISVGEVASTPDTNFAYSGLKNLKFSFDATVTLSHKYATASQLSSSPNSCPIAGQGLFCGIKNLTYLGSVQTATASFTEREMIDVSNVWWGMNWRNIGTGDLTNTGFTAQLTGVFDVKTGADITSAYHSWAGSTTSTVFPFNYRYNATTGALEGGEPAGSTENWIDDPALGFQPPINQASVDAGLITQAYLNGLNGISNGNHRWAWKYTNNTINTQVVASNPATDNTLVGVQYEWHASETEDPDSTPTADNSSYADITFLQCVGAINPLPTSGSFSTQTEQLSIFYEQGAKVNLYSAGLSGSSYTVAASNQFVDLTMHLFKLYKLSSGNDTADIVQPMNLTNLQNLATFATTYKLHFNGVISQAVNIIEYISKLSPFFLLAFISDGGRYKFSPVLPLNGSHAIDVTALTPTLTFTEANIIPGTYSKTYLSVEDRRGFIANCVYRTDDPATIGAQRTLSVRYGTTSIDAPTEQYDMSDFCIDPDHAIIYAKYELARRKYSTHNISLSTPLLTTALIPTDIIKVTRTRKSSTDDADRTETNWYQVSSVSHTADGETKIDASHFPVNGSSVSEISNEVLNGTFTVLQ
tara:strand:+ start:7164 stop:9191 length:2028 start_codon:yes stop_codon:yes gene_type:complete